jgi:protoporphyrinogen oxidase
MKPKITIIGAGISGLTAAVYLHKKGFSIQIIEASNSVGGRIKTDLIDGFRLDHGFQVLLTSYPETKALLNYEALNLKTFLPGAKVLYEGGQFDIADPFRRPSATLKTIFAPVGSLKDKINTFFLKHKLLNKKVDEIFTQKEQPTQNQLLDYGFSQKMINLFYKPFFSGIFLENNLETSNRMFDFVMKMFSEGDAAIPAKGMQEIPNQLLEMLPANSVIFNTKIVDIQNNTLFLENGAKINTDKIIIATEANHFVEKFKPDTNNQYQSVTNLYFEAKNQPIKEAVVILNASSEKKWVNNLTVLSNVSKDYAPENKVLISVSCNGLLNENDEILIQNTKEELQQWFGNSVYEWRFIKSYRIKYALPKANSVSNELDTHQMKLSENRYICGDHLLNGSINAAMKSGRLVAELINSEA